MPTEGDPCMCAVSSCLSLTQNTRQFSLGRNPQVKRFCQTDAVRMLSHQSLNRRSMSIEAWSGCACQAEAWMTIYKHVARGYHCADPQPLQLGWNRKLIPSLVSFLRGDELAFTTSALNADYRKRRILECGSLAFRITSSELTTPNTPPSELTTGSISISSRSIITAASIMFWSARIDCGSLRIKSLIGVSSDGISRRTPNNSVLPQ